MSEIKLTDQRPRTTHAELPEKLKALKPLPPDPELERVKASFLASLARRVADREAR